MSKHLLGKELEYATKTKKYPSFYIKSSQKKKWIPSIKLDKAYRLQTKDFRYSFSYLKIYSFSGKIIGGQETLLIRKCLTIIHIHIPHNQRLELELIPQTNSYAIHLKTMLKSSLVV